MHTHSASSLSSLWQQLCAAQVPGSLMSRMFSGEVPVSKVKQVCTLPHAPRAMRTRCCTCACLRCRRRKPRSAHLRSQLPGRRRADAAPPAVTRCRQNTVRYMTSSNMRDGTAYWQRCSMGRACRRTASTLWTGTPPTFTASSTS